MKSTNADSLRELLESATTPADLQAVQQLIDELDDTNQVLDDERDDVNDAESAQAHTDAVNEAQNERTALAQEIGPLPPVKDPSRRESCRHDLTKYALTYFAPALYLGLAPYQKKMLTAFQDVITKGGKKARAVRRGGLKSTLARISAAWAVDYGHRKFVVLVGATDDKSNEHRDNLFKMLETSSEHKADFPELIPLLLKRKNPKKTLRLDGEILDVTAKDERGCILYPAIAGTDSSEARIAPYSILSTDVSGLSFVDATGRVKRPDLLIFDDVQTPQSAQSFLQTTKRENAINTTFQGLAGLGETLATIMVCTRREEDCLTARYCDRERHPDWDGQMFPVLIAEPSDKQGWTKYAELLKQGDTPDEGLALATAFYRDNHQKLDEGGLVAWELDKEQGYLSALQYCMTTKILRPDFFRSELQQEGFPPASGMTQLDASVIITRLSHIDRGIVPAQASYLTAMVDSSDHVLWWMVVAWAKDCTGWIVDFGTWPDQGRATFYKSELPRQLEQQLPNRSWEEAFVNAHNELERRLIRPWTTDGLYAKPIDLVLKDWSDGGQKSRIESQILASPNRAILRPSKGFAPKPGKKPVHLWGDAKKDRHTNSHWVERRSENPIHVQFDANKFKSHIARRLQTTIGAPSALVLPGSDETKVALLAEHLTSEVRHQTTFDGAAGDAWIERPGRDNDWWDCLVGNAVAASMLGCSLPGETPTETKTRKRYTAVELHQLQQRKNG